jgi:hypothetical protein
MKADVDDFDGLKERKLKKLKDRECPLFAGF